MFNIIRYDKTPARMAGVLFFLSIMGNVFAQDTFIQSDFEHKINLYNINGRPVTNPDIDVSGTPFLLAAWKYGTIELKENAVFGNLELRLDLKTQEVHYKKPDKTELVIQAGAVKQLTLFDSSGKTPVSYILQCGFPAIDNQGETNFYEVICTGKIRLLKSLRKSIYVEKDDLGGSVQKEFRQYEDYYFFIQGEPLLQRVKKDKAYMLNLMSDKNDKIEAFLEANKLSFKSTDNIKKIVEYYNSLF